MAVRAAVTARLSPGRPNPKFLGQNSRISSFSDVFRMTMDSRESSNTLTIFPSHSLFHHVNSPLFCLPFDAAVPAARQNLLTLLLHPIGIAASPPTETRVACSPKQRPILQPRPRSRIGTCSCCFCFLPLSFASLAGPSQGLLRASPSAQLDPNQIFLLQKLIFLE